MPPNLKLKPTVPTKFKSMDISIPCGEVILVLIRVLG